MPEILHELRVKASQKQVYDAVTDQKQLASWWTTDVSAKPVMGSVSVFGFENHQFVMKMRVDRLDPGSQVEWHCLGEHPEWKDTTVTFKMRPEGEQTILQLRHAGWKSTDGLLGMCSYGWASHLTSLKSFLESGKGTPSH